MFELPNEREFGAVFPAGEYDERRRKVREAMTEKGIDLLYVSSPRNINYLTGFDSIWFYHATPTGVAVRVDSEDVIFFDSYHERMAKEFCYVTEAVFFGFPQEHFDVANSIVDTLKDRGWLGGTVGIEKWAHNPSPAVLAAIEEGMEAAGANVADGSWVVDTVALVKSPLEIACMKKAAGIADIGIGAGRKALRPDMTEIEIMSEIHYAMGRAGGEDAALRTSVMSQAVIMPHKPATRHKVQMGEMIFADICGVYNRYHANLCRFFSLGEPTKAANERMQKLAGSLPTVIEAIKPGDPVTAVGDAMQDYIDSVGLKELASRTGYSLGISIPPDWVGHTWLDYYGFVDAHFVPGTVMNYEIFSRDPDIPPVGFIDTLLMTETGLEVLSKVGQELLVAGA
ncbi:MAG: M24 family metallopeptidase [Dehalococcoidia bacterium]